MKTIKLRKRLFLFFLLVSSISFAQTKIYKGNSSLLKDVIYTIVNGRIYAGNSQSWLICNLREDKVYRKGSSSSVDILYTIRNDDKVYKRTSIFSRDVLLIIERNRIYDINYSLLAAIENDKVYNGNARLSNNILFSIEGALSTKELAVILLISTSAK